jgi:hypothetical protein
MSAKRKKRVLSVCKGDLETHDNDNEIWSDEIDWREADHSDLHVDKRGGRNELIALMTEGIVPS